MAEDKKKKKTPGLIEMGKSLYHAYMGRRKQMAETRPETRKVSPTPPAATAEPAAGAEPAKVAARPPKKKKPRGGVGGVLDTIQERKRRMAEALED